jgi:hypothetical protein
VGDEVLARAAALVDVALAGEGEGALDRQLVDAPVATRRVLADDGEQVAEQDPVLGGQPLGDLVERSRRAAGGLAGADPRVAATIQRPSVAVTRVL